MHTINGGFFWAQESGAIQVSGEPSAITISNNVIMGRPRWYQLIRWFHAFRYWLQLPHA